MGPEDFWLLYERAKEILNSEEPDFRELGSILSKLVQCLLDELQELFVSPQAEPRRERERKEAKPQPEPEPPEPEVPDLSFLYPYKVSLGRKAGSKTTYTLREFFQEFMPLHRETDFESRAKELLKQIKQGNCSIKTLSDFIALLFAYQNSDCPKVEECLLKLTL